MPGAYPLPPGVSGFKQYGGRAHAPRVHIKLFLFLDVALTTRLYFNGNEHLATDPWGAHKPSLALDLKQNGEFMCCEFDFVLATGLKGQSRKEEIRNQGVPVRPASRINRPLRPPRSPTADPARPVDQHQPWSPLADSLAIYSARAHPSPPCAAPA